MNKGFEECAKMKWGEDFVEKYEEVLEADGGPMSLRDHKVPVGLRLHVLDIWVDEVEKVDEKREAPIEKLLEPVRKMKAESLVKSVRERAKESIEDERLIDGKAWRPEEEGEDQSKEEEQEEEGDFGGFED